MNSIGTSSVVFAGVFGGALLGMFIRTVLPGHHLSEEVRDAVKLGAGLVATLTALVLGLLISSAKDSFDATHEIITQSGAKILMMDRVLANYGPETAEIRGLLQQLLNSRLQEGWPEERATLKKLPGASASGERVNVESLQGAIWDLTPKSDLQRDLRAQALKISSEMSEIRWLLFEQLQTSLPPVFLGVLIFWLVILFASFGLLTPSNGTVTAVFLVCAISVGAAIYLILEMEKPLAGSMKIPSTAMIKTLERLGK